MFWFVHIFVGEELPCFFEHVVLSGFDEFKGRGQMCVLNFIIGNI